MFACTVFFVYGIFWNQSFACLVAHSLGLTDEELLLAVMFLSVCIISVYVLYVCICAWFLRIVSLPVSHPCLRDIVLRST